MTKLDTIIAVKDVEASSAWYQAVFGCKSTHGGSNFDVLKTDNEEVLICLHKWGEHDHPTMRNPANSGNGLILYFQTDNLEKVRRNIKQIGYSVESEIQVSLNSQKKEFSLRDPDGYFIIIAEYHTYQS